MDDKEILLKLGHRIRFERFKKNLSQERLAQEAGVNTRTISALESGIKNIRFTTLYRVLKVLDLQVNVKDLVDYKL